MPDLSRLRNSPLAFVLRETSNDVVRERFVVNHDDCPEWASDIHARLKRVLGDLIGIQDIHAVVEQVDGVAACAYLLMESTGGELFTVPYTKFRQVCDTYNIPHLRNIDCDVSIADVLAAAYYLESSTIPAFTKKFDADRVAERMYIMLSSGSMEQCRGDIIVELGDVGETVQQFLTETEMQMLCVAETVAEELVEEVVGEQKFTDIKDRVIALLDMVISDVQFQTKETIDDRSPLTTFIVHAVNRTVNAYLADNFT